MATLGTEESGCCKGVVVVERWPLVQVGQVGRLLEDDLILPLSIGQVSKLLPSKIIYLSPIVSGKALIKVVLQQQSSFTFVNHQLLVKKLSGYGIKNHELR